LNGIASWLVATFVGLDAEQNAQFTDEIGDKSKEFCGQHHYSPIMPI